MGACCHARTGLDEPTLSPILNQTAGPLFVSACQPRPSFRKVCLSLTFPPRKIYFVLKWLGVARTSTESMT